MRKASWLLAAAVAALFTWGCGDEQPIELRSDGVTQWLEELASSDSSVRRHAVASLGAAWPKSARSVPVLSEALDDEDAGVRSAAESSLEALANLGWPSIHDFLRDEDDPQRGGLISAISRIRELGAKVTPMNGVEYMEHEPRGGLVFLGLGLANLTSIGSRNHASRRHLGFVGRCADPAFHAALAIDDPKWPGITAAVAAVAGMAALVPDDMRPIPESLRVLAEDGDENLASLGLVTLYLWRAMPIDPDEHSEYDAPGLDFDALVKEIQRHQQAPEGEHPPSDAWDVVRRLRELTPDLSAPQQERLAALLIEGWDSEFSRRFRVATVEVLGDLGTTAAAAAPLISKELERAEETWRQYMNEGEGEVAPGNIVALYKEIGPSFARPLELRLCAADALGRIGPSAEDAVPLLRRLVEESEPALRYVAARSLRLIGSATED